LILISGAYFPKFWVNFQNVKNPKPVSYLWLEIRAGFWWEMPGFGGKCPLPDLGATVRVSLKKLCFFAFILQTEYTPPTTMAVSFRFL
jgi:hypothetical protein